ncbi:ion transporter [Marinoscillum sp. MHG1-6]|uniref:ion transporter n=1 Tax=Marinoscillum sp. MHG1-6 TaxID=2959627 RepID=UPI00215780F8|nr:ion transporter [Marinoscillum sp. MHG1-6]
MISRILSIFLNEWIILVAILLNSILLFSMGFEGLHENDFFVLLDHLFTLFFIFEVLVKTGMYGWKKYISNSWNKFDFILVAISIPSLFELLVDIPDISYLLVFRLLRVLRILRFMRFIPNISQMIAGIVRAFRASVFVFVAILIYNILLAVLSSYLFRDEAPELFANPVLSLYSIFQVFTLEGWNEIPATVIANSDPGSWKPALTRIFFVFVVLTGGIFGMSIVNAIFVDEMVMDNNEELESKVDKLNEKIDRLLEERGRSES